MGKHRTPHLSAEQKDEAMAMYSEGKMRVSDIAEHFQKTPYCIRAIARKRGLTRGEPVYMRSYSVKDDKFSEPWTNEHSYWLGLMHADGHCSSRANSISLELKTEDGYLVEQFARFVGYTGSITRKPPHDFVSTNSKTYTSSGTVSIRFSSRKMHSDLTRMGIVSKNKTAYNVPCGHRSYLRGIFDGNGSILKQKRIGNWRWYYTGHRPAIDLFSSLANQLGVKYRVKAYENFSSMRISSTGGVLKMMRYMQQEDGPRLSRKAISDPCCHLWPVSTRKMPSAYGSHWDSNKKRFDTRITSNGKQLRIGRFKTKAQAWSAYARKSLQVAGKKSPFWRQMPEYQNNTNR